MALEEDDDDQDIRPRRKKKGSEGMSMGIKILIGLLIAGGLSVVVCCGVGYYFASQTFKMTEDPQEIAKIQAEIADITLPADYPALMGMRMNFMGVFNMAMAVYGTEGDKTVMLMQMNAAEASAEELDSQLRQQMDEQSAGQNKQVDVTESEIKTIVVNGEEREFVFAKGTDEGGQAVRQVSGTFAARNGAGMIMLVVPEEKWNEEEVLQIIQSIRK